ncbi:hypothetical protein [Friedmanniella luteola]|uniref:hypothetical protein n=1 Tax=Friedmanniella luteola TaxID=546871 RepID=UPI000B1D3E19|nr:hypothetical protein [Friedmanniella luteola]
MPTSEGREAAETIEKGIGRRNLLRTAASLGAAATVTAGAPVAATAAPRAGSGYRGGLQVLQPGTGRITGDHYLSPEADEVLWGYVPAIGAEPVLEMGSGETVTIDALSHEGILEDQGRDPRAFFAGQGVRPREVLDDAVAVARDYDRTPRDFDVDGPHVVLGPIYVRGARPGDVLKVETLAAVPRVPYGVVSSRHGKGALPQGPGRTAPAGITRSTRSCRPCRPTAAPPVTPPATATSRSSPPSRAGGAGCTAGWTARTGPCGSRSTPSWG